MDRGPSVSDEDDDLETLVPQNHAKPPSPSSRSPAAASFHVSALRAAVPSSSSLGRLLWSRRYLLLFVALPVLFLVLFVSLGGASSLRLPASIRLPSAAPATDPAASRMREAELRALYLLRSQRSGLLSLFNRTASTAPTTDASSSTAISYSDLHDALLSQIKINREIQSALLSAHRSGAAGNVTDDGLDLDLPVAGCRRRELPSNRRTIEWNPKKDRFLFAICLSGQMSNHLICLEKHMFFAALLGRILVVPSQKVDYQYDRVLDINHINDCIGRKVVMSYEEFTEKRKKVSIDQFICYAASPPCFLDEDHIKKLKGLGISLGKIQAAWPEDAKLKEPKKRIVDDIMPKFTTDAEVLAIGDMFYADVEEEWVMQPGGPLAHKCKTLIQPSRLIMLTAQRFVQTFLGGNYIALHFRRHGFLKFCNVKKESCFFPIPQAAECILRIVEKANAPVIYLSTDAAESETNVLQSLVVFNDRQVPLVRRPEHHSSEKWDALLYRNHMGGDSQVEAMLDKTICALSNVFIGSSGSTFTDDILRLRRGWGSASHCDEYLCQGELPNFIAEQD
ncbi:O-fucosyltransferase 36-like [Oryza brachyantha]|uniref:GDP-fucose protein O-fucosyltransferase 2 n=1 Tax=Oryza brachyantha TaxID=4533 RepID=J3MMA1_ORYBR|nr:O-fucosyltransferase 36-like [Oryza brachyantha]